MVLTNGLLVSLVCLMGRVPLPPSRQRSRGRPRVYSDRLRLQALIVMIVRRLYPAWALLAVLSQPEPVASHLRTLLTENGRCPCRRPWERRWQALPNTLPGLMGCLGRQLIGVLNPWQDQGPGAAVDSTGLRAHGGVWHKKDREQGLVPQTSIDTEAAWSRSGWQGGGTAGNSTWRSVSVGGGCR